MKKEVRESPDTQAEAVCDTIVKADLCHAGNYENLTGQPDMVHTPMPGAIPDLMWFVCPAEANGINIFPCTGSRHIDHKTVVVCTCACHRAVTL